MNATCSRPIRTPAPKPTSRNRSAFGRREGSAPDGFLTITGRKKEILITSGGKNLSPEHIENALKTSPFIKEAVAVGDRRNFVAALVQIEYDAVSDWAARRGIAHTSYGDLAAQPEIVELIRAEIDRANELLSRVEQARAFRILPRELHQDDGELTATQKVRRRVVLATYAELIDAMYPGYRPEIAPEIAPELRPEMRPESRPADRPGDRS